MQQQWQGHRGVWTPVWDEAWPVLLDWSQCRCTASEDRTVPAVGPPHPQSLSPVSLHGDPPKNEINLLSFSENWQSQSCAVVVWYIFRLTEDGAQRTAVPPWLKRLLVSSFFARRSNTLTESRVNDTELGPFMTVEAVVCWGGGCQTDQGIRFCPAVHWTLLRWWVRGCYLPPLNCEGPEQLFQWQNNTPGTHYGRSNTPIIIRLFNNTAI